VSPWGTGDACAAAWFLRRTRSMGSSTGSGAGWGAGRLATGGAGFGVT